MDGTQYASGSASLFASAARTPEFCLALLKSSSDGKTAEVIAIRFGEKGYYKTEFGRQTQEWCDDQNDLMGIDQATALAFEACSLFGRWSTFEDIREHMKAKVINVRI